MAKIAIFGATGYAGGNILTQATGRGHQVIAIARDTSSLTPSDDVELRPGSIHDAAFVTRVAQDADVIVVAIPGREIDGKKLLDAVPSLSEAAIAESTRVGVVGGAGSLQVSEGGPRIIDDPDFPGAHREEASSQAAVLDLLREGDQSLDWFYVSPARGFGAHAPGEATGTYRVGGEVLFFDENGKSEISGSDFALAFVDEIDKPAHRRQRFSVAY